MFERRRLLHARGKGIKVPEVAQSAQDRHRRVGDGLAVRVRAFLLDLPLADPRRDQQGRDPPAKTIELERVLAAVRRILSVGQVIRSDGQRRRDVVVETTSLIEGENEESLIPLRAGPECIVHILDEGLTLRDQPGRVHGVGALAAAGRVDEAELRQLAGSRIGVEVVHGLRQTLVAASEGPIKEVGVDHAGVRVVVLPRVAGLGELLENGALLEGMHVDFKIIVVRAMAGRCARNQVCAVGVGRLSHRC